MLSGGIMLVGSAVMKAPLPKGRELWYTALTGVVVLGGGNGCLVLAETWIPSGLAALMITISPFWLAGFNAMLPPREPLHGPTLWGLAIGLGGAVLLVGPGALAGGAAGQAVVKGFVVLQLGCVLWCLGSLLQRKQRTRAHPIVGGAVQQLAAGLAFVPLAILFPGPLHLTAKGVGALLYLVVFGSIVGYSSFVYAMDRLPVPVVSLYNYVNPVVAVVLGYVFYQEPFGAREAIAMAIIFLGVAVVKRVETSRPSDRPERKPA
jgi:drug/metabolite transporter (DMT)-like permease